MVRVALAALGLAALWLFMSGLFKPLLLAFGVISVAMAIWVLWRMENADGERLAYVTHPIRTAFYAIWLLGEIIKANFAVIKLILSPEMRLNQRIFDVPATQKYDLTSVIFANSITLTPGTITVATEQDHFLVHAVNYHDEDDAALADMDRRVTRLETSAGESS